ncbi:MAG: hypothetical protein B7C54_11570 [Acidimicrobiales bacterium mtb01]|nr:hypothetical protein [Actinomycetota bacterium]TEX45686.1 MAG: hypothetical protein B7C54_11570 [Acidimicrobiales bacterium mtb01]
MRESPAASFAIETEFVVGATTVWDYVVDPRNDPEWRSGVRAVTGVTMAPGVAPQQYELIGSPMGADARTAVTLEAAVRPTHAVWSQRIPKFEVVTTLELTTVDGGTHGRFTVDLHGSKAMAVVVRKAIQAGFNKDLQRLQSALA